MNPKSPILLLLACLCTLASFGQYGAIEFVENKGQWPKDIRYKGDVPVGSFIINESGFTVLQHHPKDMERIAELQHGHSVSKTNIKSAGTPNVRSHSYKVDFIGGNEHPRIVADKLLPTYNNYFTGSDPSKWVSNCRIYLGVTVENIYPNIDVRYYSDNGYLKYDLIVKPGGDPYDIALRYNGPDKIEVKNKELIIKTSVGDLREKEPYSYQYNSRERKDVPVKYSLRENVVRFDIKNHDPQSTLVIDPALVFATFTGSTSDNWGYTATYGPDGSMFGGGIVWGPGFPASPGAYDGTFGGGGTETYDIAIMKLSPDGSQRIYATYIGGSGDEQPHSLVADAQGNLIIAGRSNSGNGYPTRGPGLIGPGGNYDIVITKLNATGTDIIGSVRIGGSMDDGVNISTARTGPASSLLRNYGDDGRSEVILDNAGSIFMASSTMSANFPTGAGAVTPFQSTYGGGPQDGVLLKFDANLTSLRFASFLGGGEEDAAYVLSQNPTNGNIYVAGGTESDNLPGDKSGTVGPAINGSIDGYLSIISNDGRTIFKTSYIGTGGMDQVYGVQFDRLGFPYVMGQTTGTWKIINAPWNQPAGKQFIAKLRPDLSSYVYSTAFGSGGSVPNISPIAFLVDRCENVYLSGWGGQINDGPPAFPNAGTKGLPITPDAIKKTTDNKDLYFFVLKRDAASQLYGSFFGQDGGSTDHVDGGTSRFDQSGVIYQAVCGNCQYLAGATNVPTTPGSWSPQNKAGGHKGGCNLMMIKISFDLAGVRGGIQSAINGVPRDTAGCVPLTVTFSDTVQNAVSYEWNFGDGTPTVRSITPSINHTYTSVGTFRVMLVAIDSSTCNLRDTSYMNIRVGDQIAPLDFRPVKLSPPCDVFNYRFENLSVAPPALPFSGQIFEWDFGDGTPRVRAPFGPVNHTYKVGGTYVVKLFLRDDRYCNSPDSVVKTLRVAANVRAIIETPATGCAPYLAQFTNVSEGGDYFTWNFGDGGTSTEVSPAHLYTTPGTYTVSLTAIDSNTCNIRHDTSIVINIYALPTAAFGAAPQPPVNNTPITFTNSSSPDAIRFKWLFGDGDSLVTNSRFAIQHEYNRTGTFTACLIAFNQNNCSDTVCQEVRTIIDPVLDIPTAFTPLSGDVNNKVFVRGFGIAKMKFTIWSRWGEKVFESNDKSIGWDGRFKGKVLPMDVYAYTLEAELSDGTKVTRKGDITLIR